MVITKVSIRRKKISDGRLSLYIRYYPPIRDPKTMKPVYEETTGIYVFENPQTQLEIKFNQEMEAKVEAIRGMRYQACLNEEYGFLDKNQQKGDFLQFFFDLAVKKDKKWLIVYQHFRAFVGGKCTFADVTVDLCNKFREYLLKTKQISHPEKPLKKNSQAGYFSTFRACLKVAYKNRLLKENVNDFLDKIPWEDTKREFLTMEELNKLVETPCAIPVLKRASLFACLTGLRFSDVLALKWEDIQDASLGGKCMRIRTDKTETEATLPLSAEALIICGERKPGLVFEGFKKTMCSEPLRKWVKSAGINKHITFHCFRHTFATLQLALGTDIYTVKNMLTHRFVSTTEIYTHIIDSKKVESANRINIQVDYSQLEKLPVN